ncbi:hypothetical protein AB7340_00310 [Providencia alcalifaciens]
MKNNIIILLVAPILVLFLLPFLVYWHYFSDFGISTINANWGSFGSYLGGIFSIFTAIFTFISVLVLVQTFRKTIHFSQQQIKIAQNESELNNFNFIINLIHKNIRENPKLTKKIKEIGISTFYEQTNTDFLNDNFGMIINFAVKKLKSDDFSDIGNELLIEMSSDLDLKNNINKYSKRYAFNHLAILSDLYPLVKSLCTKIVNSKDDIQKEMLRDILTSAIDENILYWSLAIINDNRFDSFMILPKKIEVKL